MTVSYRLEQDRLIIAGALERFELSNKQLYQFPKAKGAVEIDLKLVTNFDTAGLAWLLKLVSFYQHRRCEVKISNVPDQLIALAEISNVLKLLPIESK